MEQTDKIPPLGSSPCYNTDTQVSTESGYDELDITILDDTDSSKLICPYVKDGRPCVYRRHAPVTISLTVREPQSCASEITSAISSHRLYDIECTHSKFKWKIVRKYHQFEELHRTLRMHQAKMLLKFKSKFYTVSKNHLQANPKKESISERNLSRMKDGTADTGPPEDGATSARETIESEARGNGQPLVNWNLERKSHETTPQANRGTEKVKDFGISRLKFPRKPEMFITDPTKIEKRRIQLEMYLNTALKDFNLRHHPGMLRFVEISSISFCKHSGEKFHEGTISKRSGGQRKLTAANCYSFISFNWRDRWLVLKDSYLCYLRRDGVVADIMLFDRDWQEPRRGIAETHRHHGVTLSNSVRELNLKTTSFYRARNWADQIFSVAEKSEYTKKHRFDSFAPKRPELAKWYIDGSGYFKEVFAAIMQAKREIFITDWWLSPALFLKRPVVTLADDTRLDRALLLKAKEGVKIYILLYKEVPQAVKSIQSLDVKRQLEALHPNILVMRHPDHMKEYVVLWSHHEKIVCIDQKVAFLGGMDLAFGRWDDWKHRVTDVGSVKTVLDNSDSISIQREWKGIGRDDLIKEEKEKRKSAEVRGTPPRSRSSSLSRLVRRTRSLATIRMLAGSDSLTQLPPPPSGLQVAGVSTAVKTHRSRFLSEIETTRRRNFSGPGRMSSESRIDAPEPFDANGDIFSAASTLDSRLAPSQPINPPGDQQSEPHLKHRPVHIVSSLPLINDLLTSKIPHEESGFYDEVDGHRDSPDTPCHESLDSLRRSPLGTLRRDSMDGPRRELPDAPHRDSIGGPRRNLFDGPRRGSLDVLRRDSRDGPRRGSLCDVPRRDSLDIPRGDCTTGPRHASLDRSRPESLHPVSRSARSSIYDIAFAVSQIAVEVHAPPECSSSGQSSGLSLVGLSTTTSNSPSQPQSAQHNVHNRTPPPPPGTTSYEDDQLNKDITATHNGYNPATLEGNGEICTTRETSPNEILQADARSPFSEAICPEGGGAEAKPDAMPLPKLDVGAKLEVITIDEDRCQSLPQEPVGDAANDEDKRLILPSSQSTNRSKSMNEADSRHRKTSMTNKLKAALSITSSPGKPVIKPNADPVKKLSRGKTPILGSPANIHTLPPALLAQITQASSVRKAGNRFTAKAKLGLVRTALHDSRSDITPKRSVGGTTAAVAPKVKFGPDVKRVPSEENRRPWKKIRANLHKLSRIAKHTELLKAGGDSSESFRCDMYETNKSELELGLRGRGRLWHGRDYANWIFKDLDGVKDKPMHDVIDRMEIPRMPWHDIGVCVFDRCATDVARHFIQRWNHDKKIKSSTMNDSRYPLLLPRSTSDLSGYTKTVKDLQKLGGNHELVHCQVVRSYPDWASGTPQGVCEKSIQDAYIELINQAKHYIYIENQYFISIETNEVKNKICDALVKRIERAHREQQTFRVFIVIPLLPAFEADHDPQQSVSSALYRVLNLQFQSLCRGEKSLIRRLSDQGILAQNYVSICGLRAYGELNNKLVTELIYVHSKLMIVDDRKAIIGSANINDRSMLGSRDSEIAVVIEDQIDLVKGDNFCKQSTLSGKDWKAGKFCYSLRNQIFREHLGLRADEIVDDITCDHFFKHVWLATASRNSRIFAEVFPAAMPRHKIYTRADYLNVLKKKQERDTEITSNEQRMAELKAGRQKLKEVKGHLVLYPLNYLEKEDLTKYFTGKEGFLPLRFWT